VKLITASKLFALVSICLGIFSAAAFAQETPLPAPEAAPAQLRIAPFDIKDINSRIIRADELKGWIVVYAFGNEDNADQGVAWLKEAAKTRITSDGVMFVIIADASRYPKVTAPFIKKVLKKEYRKEMDKLQGEVAEKNIVLPFKLEDRYWMIADFSGAYFAHFGIADQKNIPHIFFVDGDGNMRGHFTERTDEMVATLGALVDERDSKKLYALQITRKKKNLLRRWGLIGLGAFLIYEVCE
jgi:hypothetical protein